MDDEKAFAIMFSVVRLALQELTDAELVGLHLAAHLGLDPRGKPGYDKIAYLFTQENGTKCTKKRYALIMPWLSKGWISNLLFPT